MKKYIDKELCAACKGACCKENGCIYLPNDFKYLDFDNLKDLISIGNISISGQPFNGFLDDCWSYLLYLRARNLDAPIVDLFTSGGPCKLLTDAGCTFNTNERPALGLLVKPTIIGGPCQKKFTQDDILKWMEYNNVLEELVQYYTDKSLIDVIINQMHHQLEIIKYKKENQIDLTKMEKQNLIWYYQIIVNKPYYNIEEVKQLILI